MSDRLCHRLHPLQDKQKGHRPKQVFTNVADLDAEGQAAYLWEKMLKHLASRTELEREDLEPCDNELATPSPKDFKGERAPGTFPKLLKAVWKTWQTDCALRPPPSASSSPSGRRGPHVLVICGSAIGAVELLKPLGQLKCRVAKLFAKHLKVKQQQEMLATFSPVAVGTPNRLAKLMDLGALVVEDIR